MTTTWMDVVKDCTAGTIGGCSGIAVGHPLDTIKVRLQSRPDKFRSAIDCFRKTVQHEGPLALFRGLVPPLVGNAPLNAVVFGTYGQTMRMLDQHFPDQPNADPFKPNFPKLLVAGFVAGSVQCLVTTPVELVKCKLQYQMSRSSSKVAEATYAGPFDCARQIFRKNGVPGLYRGNLTAWLRDAPSYGAYFAIYEGIKWLGCDYLRSTNPSSMRADGSVPAPLWLQLLGGGVAGVVTWTMSYAADPLKSVIQTMPESATYQETRASVVARNMYRQHGWRFFFRGIGPTLVRSFPTNAVTLMVYDKSLEWMNSVTAARSMEPEFE